MSSQPEKSRDPVDTEYDWKCELWRRQYYNKFHGLEEDTGHPQVSDAYSDPSYMAELDDKRRNGTCNLF